MLAAEREGRHADVFQLSLCEGLSVLQLQRLHQVTLRVVEILKAASGEGSLRMSGTKTWPDERSKQRLAKEAYG